MPEVSIVMSVYNGEQFLRQSIDSLLNQTWKDFELIIVNDGSSDSSAKIIRSYQDNRILSLDNEVNRGLIFSLNRGIGSASGRFIARMDADDIALPYRIERQLQFLRENPNIAICGSSTYHLLNNKLTFKPSHSEHDEIACWMLFNSALVHPTLMFRASVFENEEIIFDSAFPHAEDYELWSRLLFKHKMVVLKEPLLQYRIHKNQVTNKHNQVQLDSANKVRERILHQAGFVFNDKQFELHCKIGSSVLITDIGDLQSMGAWLIELYEQNRHLSFVPDGIMRSAVHKLWEDACGNTNLGWSAFYYFFQCPIHHFGKSNWIKLAAKCLIRRFQ